MLGGKNGKRRQDAGAFATITGCSEGGSNVTTSAATGDRNALHVPGGEQAGENWGGTSARAAVDKILRRTRSWLRRSRDESRSGSLRTGFD